MLSQSDGLLPGVGAVQVAVTKVVAPVRGAEARRHPEQLVAAPAREDPSGQRGQATQAATR